ncbi:MAG: hypothetical protein HY562_12895, partial [Ignavibacteriales bacterium]|nr:hypothetical protein [Ignavibacteriales bacterium]
MAIASFVLLSIFLTSSRAQTKWFKYESNPVLDVGPKGAWDSENSGIKRVIRQGSTYQMWFTGRDGKLSRSGYATSRDGIFWTKYRSNPVLSVTPQSWDKREAYMPYVIFSDSMYQMWYTGAVNAGGWIGYATSLDGIEWKKEALPVLNKGPLAWDAGSVIHASVLGPDEAGAFKMWYWGMGSTFTQMQIGYATATDAKTWTKHGDPVLTIGSSGSWDDNRVQTPRTIFNGQFYEMWYAGTKTDINRSFIGYASSLDGIHWSKSPDNPVIKPGRAGLWDDESIWPGDIRLEDNIYYMWYIGYDGSKRRTGLAVSPKGLGFSMSPPFANLIQQNKVHFVLKVDNSRDLTFSARIRAPRWREYTPDIGGAGATSEIDV